MEEQEGRGQEWLRTVMAVMIPEADAAVLLVLCCLLTMVVVMGVVACGCENSKLRAVQRC